MKKLLLSLFILVAAKASAQETPDFSDMRSWWIREKDTTERYVFSDTAFIRAEPGAKGTPADTLFAGDNVTVTNVFFNKFLIVRGLTGPWLKIDYTKNGERKSGYIWQGLVSCVPLRRGDTKFVYAIDRHSDSTAIDGKDKYTISRFVVTMKVVQNGRIVARISFITPNDDSANFTDGKIMSGLGLSNVQNIITLTFSGDACGVPTYDYYFAWTAPNRLVQLPTKENVGDAGAFYHGEILTFPSEKNGQPDMIIWNSSTDEATGEMDKDGNEVLKTTEKKSARYSWDGINGTITKQKQPATASR